MKTNSQIIIFFLIMLYAQTMVYSHDRYEPIENHNIVNSEESKNRHDVMIRNDENERKKYQYKNETQEYKKYQHDKTGHEKHGHEVHIEKEDDQGLISLSGMQQKMAGIVVAPVNLQKAVGAKIYAPGEVVNNLYNTTVVTAQVDSKVLKRYVVLGQHVHGGDALVKLFSQQMVNIQSRLKVAAGEWQRVQTLGQQSVGSKRFTGVRVNYEKEIANALAAGMSRTAVTQLLQETSALTLGQYIVEAPYEGTVQADNFQQGQLLPAGTPIVTVVDETRLWVEARLAPQLDQHINTGSKAEVIVHNRRFSATVIQENHAIEEITRTRKVRLLLENKDHLLHPGLFVDVYLTLAGNQSGTFLPQSALVRADDGNWFVYTEQAFGHYKAWPVQLINGHYQNGQEQTINTGDERVLVQGLSAGQRVVLQGAFFLASEQAKAGFDPHNH